MLCSIARAKIRAWFQAYDNLQSLAIVLLYSQIACALIGSLGASYTGILLVNLAVALFALVAIESGSQTLGRTYAVLLLCSLLLDIAWFVLFSVEIRQVQQPQSNIGKFTAFSLQLVLWMQIGGFVVRFSSAFLWLQMYRLGPTSDQGALYQHIDPEGRVGFFTPTSSPRTTTRQSSLSDEVLGGSIYNPAYYSSLFSPPHELLSVNEVDKEVAVFKGSDSCLYHPPQHSSGSDSSSHGPARRISLNEYGIQAAGMEPGLEPPSGSEPP